MFRAVAMAMQKLALEASRFCISNLSVILASMSATLFAFAGVGIAFAIEMTGSIADTKRQAEITQAQFENHIHREYTYNREVRDIMRSLDTRSAMMQSDIAVLMERTNNER